MQTSSIGGYGTPNFEEKTFVGGSKTMKFVNVFSLENFPLYNIYSAKISGYYMVETKT